MPPGYGRSGCLSVCGRVKLPSCNFLTCYQDNYLFSACQVWKPQRPAATTGYAKALELPGDNYGFIPSIGMVVGYICGATLIPKYLSQATAMKICAIIAIIGSALVATMPAEISIYCIFFMALGCSLMWPALWPLAMADLGKFTKAGSSLLTMAIAGGAVMPWVRGVIQDATSFQTSYWICVPCFLFILYYGMIGYKIRTKK